MKLVILFIIGFFTGEVVGWLGAAFFHNVKENNKQIESKNKEV